MEEHRRQCANLYTTTKISSRSNCYCSVLYIAYNVVNLYTQEKTTTYLQEYGGKDGGGGLGMLIVIVIFVVIRKNKWLQISSF